MSSDSLSARLGREFAPGEVLFREGEAGEVMYVVQTGAVRITKHVENADKLLAVLGPGEFFGEMAILNGKPRTATATALEASRCLLIDPRTLEEMVARNTEIALRLIKKLARRLDSADSLVEVLLHRDPKARVLMALSRHAEAFGEETPEGVVVRSSTRELAAEAHVEEFVAHEMMRRVGRLGIAHERGERIVVSELGRLRDFVEFLEVPHVATSNPSHVPEPPPGGEGGASD